MFHPDESAVPDRWRPSTFGYSLIPHMRSDNQRHAVLMKHGGLWLEADVRLMSSPAEWASGWTDYTVARIRDKTPLLGTDIIYADREWSGWNAVDDYISSLVSSKPKRLSVLAFAHDLIDHCMKTSGAVFHIAEPGNLLPHNPNDFDHRSLVARGFDPPAPGLGDMIAAGLDAIGITKERVQAVASTVGIKDCGCGKRQRIANEIGAKYLGIGRKPS